MTDEHRATYLDGLIEVTWQDRSYSAIFRTPNTVTQVSGQTDVEALGKLIKEHGHHILAAIRAQREDVDPFTQGETFSKTL